MFVAIVIPVAKDDRNVLLAAVMAVICSSVFTYAPLLSRISSGTRIIIVTVVISAIAALIFPVKEEEKTADGE